MLSDAKHLWLLFGEACEKQSEILHFAQNDKALIAVALRTDAGKM